MSVKTQDVETLLAESAATEEFKQDVRNLGARQPVSVIRFSRAVPPVKALRGICKLLEEFPELEVRSATIDGQSGCSDFSGNLDVNDGEAKFKFVWDCAWRAQQEGFKDSWGSPDQIRAAREFGYQCFKKFERVN